MLQASWSIPLHAPLSNESACFPSVTKPADWKWFILPNHVLYALFSRDSRKLTVLMESLLSFLSTLVLQRSHPDWPNFSVSLHQNVPFLLSSRFIIVVWMTGWSVFLFESYQLSAGFCSITCFCYLLMMMISLKMSVLSCLLLLLMTEIINAI